MTSLISNISKQVTMEKGASGQIYYFHENFPSQIFGKAVNVPLYIRFRTTKVTDEACPYLEAK